jgi:hypothetical protein
MEKVDKENQLLEKSVLGAYCRVLGRKSYFGRSSDIKLRKLVKKAKAILFVSF